MADTVELATAYINLVPSLSGVQGNLAKQLGAPLEDAAEKAGDQAGKGFSAKFAAGVKVGAAAAGAALVASVVGAVGKEKANDKLAASLGLTPAESKRLGGIAGRLYAGAYGESLGDVNGAVAAVRSGIAGMAKASDADLEAVTKRALDFATAMDMDVSSAATSAGLLVKQGLAGNATEAFDLMTKASQQVAPELRETVLEATDEYSGFFRSVGIDGPEAFALLVDGAGAGEYGIDKAGDAIKEFGIRATDIGDVGAQDALKAIGLSGRDMANSLLAGGDTAGAATQKIVTGLLGIKDPGKQAEAAIALFGTPLEDIGKDKIPEFLTALKSGSNSMDGFAGSTDALGKTLNDNASSNLESFKRQAIGLFVDTIGGRALPAVSALAATLATEFGPAVAGIIGWLSQAAGWAQQNEGALKALGIVIGTILLPALLAAGVQAATAWTAAQVAALRSSLAQIGALYKTAAGWVLSGAAAIRSGAQTVAIWLMLQADAVKSGAAQVAAHARVAAAWVASKAKAVASGVVIVGQWVAMQAAAVGSAAMTVASNARAAASFVAQKVAMLAGVAAMGIVRGATVAWTAVQWLLNAALTANPIGLIIAGIVLLVAGLVLAYKKSDTFRRIVDTALRAVGAAFGWLWGKAQELFRWVASKWPLIKNILLGPIGLAVKLIITHWGTITGKFRTAVAWVRSAFAVGWAVLRTILTAPVRLAAAAIDGLLGAAAGIRGRLSAAATWARGVFRAAWSALKAVLTDPVGAAKTAIANILGKTGLQKVFSSAVTAVGKIWDGLKALARKPIEFVVNTVLKNGLVAAFDKIVGLLPGGSKLKLGPKISWPEFFDGGSTGNKPRRTPIPALLHGNEHVATAAEVAATPGGHSTWERLRGMALAGTLGDVLEFFHGGQVPLPGATSIARHGSGYPWARWAGDLNRGSGAQDLGDPIKAWKSGVVASVKHLTTSYGKHVRINHGESGQTLSAHLSKIMVSAGQSVSAGQTIGLLGSTGNSSGPHLHWELKGGNAPIGTGSADTGGSASAGVSAGSALGKLITGGVTRIKELLGAPLQKMDELGPSPVTDLLKAVPGGLVAGLVEKAKGMIPGSDALAGAISGISGAASAAANAFKAGVGVARWTPEVSKALSLVGQSQFNIPRTLRRMNQESGGNPRAINNWDINARNGIPSKGLMQVIDPTFRAYRDKSLPNDIWDPLANITASMRYALARYGSLSAAYDKAGGYALGTSWATPGLHPVAERGAELVLGRQNKLFAGGERVLDPSQTARAMTGGKGKELHIHGNLYGDDLEQRILNEWEIRERRELARAVLR